MEKPDLSACPVIAAVKNEAQLELALQTECELIFLLFGDILNIDTLTRRVRDADKLPMVHIDLINGLSSREIAVDFIAKTTRAAGIISTKPSLIRRAKELGLFTILRVFALDSMAFENIRKERAAVEPDVVEVLPGVIPAVIRQLCELLQLPVIAGGLIAQKKDVLAALDAGAAAVSTTNEAIWRV